MSTSPQKITSVRPVDWIWKHRTGCEIFFFSELLMSPYCSNEHPNAKEWGDNAVCSPLNHNDYFLLYLVVKYHLISDCKTRCIVKLYLYISIIPFSIELETRNFGHQRCSLMNSQNPTLDIHEVVLRKSWRLLTAPYHFSASKLSGWIVGAQFLDTYIAVLSIVHSFNKFSCFNLSFSSIYELVWAEFRCVCISCMIELIFYNSKIFYYQLYFE